MTMHTQIKDDPVTTIKYHPTEGVPVKYFLDPVLMPDESAINPLKELARVRGIRDYVVALPDLHKKDRNLVPTGLVSVSDDYLIPFAVDKGINCGIRIMALPLKADDFSDLMIESFFKNVMKRVPGDRHPNKILNKEEVRQILLKGADWVVKNYDIPESDLLNIERSGNMFRNGSLAPRKILKSIPYDAVKKGRRSLGVLGGGNHFLELQKIVEIADESLAARLNLEKGQLVLMLHSGTGGVGGAVMKHFHQVMRYRDTRDKLEHLWAKFRFLNFLPWDADRLKWFQAPHLYGIKADSPTGRHFINAINAVANFGFANRMIISYQAEMALRQVLRDDSVRLRLLYDSSHVTIQREHHFGREYWVHRNGANQAAPASYMQTHPVYRETGQPIPIPGSMGTDSYIAVAAEGARRTFCSANHGAGRLMDKPDARLAFKEKNVVDTMRDRGIMLFRYGKSPITDQAPQAFKNIENVVEVMEKYELARPVARVSPLAVLKG